MSARLSRALAYGFAACAAVAAVVLSVLPAAWIAPNVEQAFGGRIALRDLDGSIWNGSASIALTSADNATASTALPGRLAFATDFWPLLSGHLVVHLAQTTAMPKTVGVDFSRSRVLSGPATITLPAAILSGLGAPFNTLGLTGTVTVQSNSMTFQGGAMAGHVEVLLDDMSSRMSSVKPLGSWRLVLDGHGGPAALTLTTVTGPLSLNGSGTWSAAGLSFRGHASASDNANSNLADLLSILGRPDGTGVANQLRILNIR